MRIPVFHGEFTEVYVTEVQALNQAQYLLGRVDQINLVSFRLFLDVWGDTTGGLGLVFLAANTWKERLGLWSPMHANGSRARHTGRSLWKLLREDFLASNRFGLEQRGGKSLFRRGWSRPRLRILCFAPSSEWVQDLERILFPPCWNRKSVARFDVDAG